MGPNQDAQHYFKAIRCLHRIGCGPMGCGRGQRHKAVDEINKALELGLATAFLFLKRGQDYLYLAKMTKPSPIWTGSLSLSRECRSLFLAWLLVRPR
jgi:hypothetical protein